MPEWKLIQTSHISKDLKVPFAVMSHFLNLLFESVQGKSIDLTKIYKILK